MREHGVWYAVELQLNRDASLYLDTRNLREWILRKLHGQRVLNTFAYTGSLGIAARAAAGAARVVHLDLNRAFLNVAKTSYTLNGFPIHKPDFQTGDFLAANQPNDSRRRAIRLRVARSAVFCHDQQRRRGYGKELRHA